MYEPANRVSGLWTSPYNTLLYKRPTDTSHLKCRYFFQVIHEQENKSIKWFSSTKSWHWNFENKGQPAQLESSDVDAGFAQFEVDAVPVRRPLGLPRSKEQSDHLGRQRCPPARHGQLHVHQSQGLPLSAADWGEILAICVPNLNLQCTSSSHPPHSFVGFLKMIHFRWAIFQCPWGSCRLRRLWSPPCKWTQCVPRPFTSNRVSRCSRAATISSTRRTSVDLHNPMSSTMASSTCRKFSFYCDFLASSNELMAFVTWFFAVNSWRKKTRWARWFALGTLSCRPLNEPTTSQRPTRRPRYCCRWRWPIRWIWHKFSGVRSAGPTATTSKSTFPATTRFCSSCAPRRMITVPPSKVSISFNNRVNWEIVSNWI